MKKKVMVSLLLLVVIALFAYRCHVLDKPFFAVAVSSCSMDPVVCRGDVVFIRPVHKETNFNINQIVLFKAEHEGVHQWIMHRIVGECCHGGYITQGDNNSLTDQSGLGFPLIEPEWIGGIVPQIGARPIKIPMLGHITLTIDEKLNACPFVTGLLINTTFFALALTSLKTLRIVGKHKKRRKLTVN